MSMLEDQSVVIIGGSAGMGLATARLAVDEVQRDIARLLAGERERLWARWVELDEQLDLYAARRPGETAVVVLSPLD